MRFIMANEKYNILIEKFADKAAQPIINVVVLIIYKALLDLIYCLYIGNNYLFFYIEISLLNVINGWILTLISTLFINIYYKNECASSILLVILNMIYFIPITTYCGWGGGSSKFMFYAAIYWMILLILQYKIPIITFKFPKTVASDKWFYILVAMFSAFSLFIWAKYANFRIMFNIIEVYDVRAEAAAYNIPIIISYIRQFSAIVIPMLILLSLVKKKYLILVWLLFITFINFSFAGSKTVILFPFLLIGGYIFYRSKMISLIFPIGILLEVMAIIENAITGSSYIVSLLFRRMGLVLGQLSEYFFRFFESSSTDIFRNSIMSKLGFDSIYNQTLANVIGNNFETQIVNCNNGLLADVWSGLGIIGVVVMPIILIICFRLFDLVSYGIDARVIISLAAYYAIIFANATWSTVLISHGFLIMCLMLILFPRVNENKGY